MLPSFFVLTITEQAADPYCAAFCILITPGNPILLKALMTGGRHPVGLKPGGRLPAVTPDDGEGGGSDHDAGRRPVHDSPLATEW